MKVVVLAKTLSKGGAASGARNLLCALRAAGAEVVALDATMYLKWHPLLFARTVERIYERLVHNPEIHCLRLGPPTFKLHLINEEHRPDIIQLCDVSANVIKFADISMVTCPIFHRMSDFWPYHGAHHYADIRPDQPDLADRTLNKFIFDGKVMPHCRVAPSEWLASRLGGRDVRVIRNAVTIPNNIITRKPKNGVLRYGFISSQIMDPRKGYTALAPFLTMIAYKLNMDIKLHVFGRTSDKRLAAIPSVEIFHQPPFSSVDLASVYQSFDILLCPSRLDNSPNVVSEALSYGTPVIGQTGTGMSSYIEDEFGGLVDFHNFNRSNFEKFLEITQNIIIQYRQYSSHARRFACEELSPVVIGEQYLKLYESQLNRI